MNERHFNVSFTFEGQDIDSINVNKSCTISNFLLLVKEQTYLTEEISVYLKGKRLNEDDLLINYINDPKRDILYISSDSDVSRDILYENELKNLEYEGGNEELDYKYDDNFDGVKSFKVFTTVTFQSFLRGDKLNIDINESYDAVLRIIQNHIQSIVLSDFLQKYDIHIFLPGGILFNPSKTPIYNSLKSYFTTMKKAHYCLYVIVTKELGDFVDEEVTMPLNCVNLNKFMLSPLFESTTAGLTQISSFLNYLYYNGPKSEHLMNIFAKVTRFAPLIVNVFRLLTHSKINVLNIVSITVPLWLFFQNIIPGVDKEKIFEQTLATMEFISLLTDTNTLKMGTINLNNKEEDQEVLNYFNKTDQQDQVVLWVSDFGENKFKGYNIDPLYNVNLLIDNSIYEASCAFMPIKPLSLRLVNQVVGFVRGENEKEVFIYLNENRERKEVINYIDPKNGSEILQSTALELSAKYKIDDEEQFIKIVENNSVDQIIVFCVDESISSKPDFYNGLIDEFINSKNTSIYGLINFGNEVKICQEFTSISSKFKYDELNETVKSDSKLLLYDAIQKAKELFDQIVLNQEEDDDDDYNEVSYPNSDLRIILISSCSDKESKTVASDLVKGLINQNIIVDTIFVSENDETSEKEKEMFVVSKMTGGICYKLNETNQGLEFIKQNEFVNIKKRFIDPPYNFINEITEKQLNEEINKFCSFDNEVKNKEIIKSNFYKNNRHVSVTSPLYMLNLYKDKVKTLNVYRALCELDLIRMNKSDEFVVFPSSFSPEEWLIFIKGPDQTPFEKKWLNLALVLTSSFPVDPPFIRFLSVPFHPNVSNDGTVKFDLIDKKYKKDLSFKSIIEGIVKLLKDPDVSCAINQDASKLFINDKDEFVKRQKDGEIGKNDYNEFLDEIKIYN